LILELNGSANALVDRFGKKFKIVSYCILMEFATVLISSIFHILISANDFSNRDFAFCEDYCLYFSEFYGQPVGISKLGLFPEKGAGSFFLVFGQLRWHSKKMKTTSG
jgi:hypothetical protein